MSGEISTHKCNAEYWMCHGTDPCEMNVPDKIGKSFRTRCGAGFFVKFVPVDSVVVP
jgi:hypothetical protein